MTDPTADDDLVVVLVDPPEADPVVVAIDEPTLGEVAVVVLEEGGEAGPGSGLDFFSGDGPPEVVVGAGRGDLYLDTTSGQLYRLT